MQEINEQIVMLLYKRIAGEELEAEEEDTLGKWLAESSHHQALLDELQDEPRLENEVRALMAIDENAALKKLQDTMALEKGKKRSFPAGWVRYTAAAIIIVLAVAGMYTFYYRKPGGKTVEKLLADKAGIKADDYNILLIPQEGPPVVLDSTPDGPLKNQPGTIINKDKGSVVYEQSQVTIIPGVPVAFNTISVSQKRQCDVTLPDGSRISLNAASSVRFPVAFTGQERKIFLKGEAYIEAVTKVNEAGVKIPFKVAIMSDKGEKGEVEVLGTRFNINAYPEEPAINTVLLEGKVQLRSANKAQPLIVLAPGQGAQLAGNGTVKVAAVDAEQAIAWKSGHFPYKNMTIEAIMRAASRWYGVRVRYEGTITTTFSGEIRKSEPISTLLNSLEMSGEVRFSVEGDTITVKNKS